MNELKPKRILVSLAHPGDESFAVGGILAKYAHQDVHPKALAVLAEIGIQHEGRSKSADEFRGADFDLVVAVCDSAAEECPVWLGKGKRVYYSFPDPAKIDDLSDFRKVRDDIIQVIPPLLEAYGN